MIDGASDKVKKRTGQEEDSVLNGVTVQGVLSGTVLTV
jgi:hypothetical protein